MPEGKTAENLVHDSMDSNPNGVGKLKTSPFFEDDNAAGGKSNRLFGREKPVHGVLGGGKPADVLLWRNKTISASVLGSATGIWLLFEWLNYHLLTLICIALVLLMLMHFLWTNAQGMMFSVILAVMSVYKCNSSLYKLPRVSIPEEVFINIAKKIGGEVNRGLGFLQDVSSGGNMKHFLIVVSSLWAAAVIASWCNFITVLYIGFVAAHTLPVLYERYDDQVDSFLSSMFDHLWQNYRKFDAGVLKKIPSPKSRGKKGE